MSVFEETRDIKKVQTVQVTVVFLTVFLHVICKWKWLESVRVVLSLNGRIKKLDEFYQSYMVSSVVNRTCFLTLQ